MIKILKIKQLYFFAAYLAIFSVIFTAFLLPKNIFAANEVETSGTGLAAKVAPGESLPLSVKLLNFGNNNEVDVTLTYNISDSAGRVIYSSQETVAVQTTATFIKSIPIPQDTPPGRYVAKSTLIYADQVTPATTQFPFTVERKIFGIFQGDFILYGAIVLFFGIIIFALGHVLIRRSRKVRYTAFDYSDIPHAERSYYEILSDTIMEMRQRVGDDALVIAENIDGLKIDGENGRVLGFTQRPSKIIAKLVSRYEELLGKKVSFSLRQK